MGQRLCFRWESYWPEDLECLFAPLLPAGHTKAQKGYIDSTLQGVVAQQKGNGTLFQLPSPQYSTPNQRGPDPFVGVVSGQGREGGTVRGRG